MLRISFIIVCVCALASSAYGQLTIAPTFVSIDVHSKSASVQFMNSSPAAEEVILETRFGYASIDSTGNRYMEYADLESEADYSISDYLRFFPSRFRLEPGASQVVRLFLDGATELEDGVYWTRLAATSRPIEAVDGGADIEVQFRYRQIIPVVMQVGRLSAEVRLISPEIDLHADGIRLTALVERSGPVPFFGTLRVDITRPDGTPVGGGEKTIDVYFKQSAVLPLQMRGLRPGPYVARVRLLAERSGVPSERLPRITADPVILPFRVPENSPH